MQRWMTVWWCQSTKGYRPRTKPNQVFPGHLLAKHVDSCLCPICKHLKVSIYFCFLPIALWKGKIPTLSDACKTPPVIKHHTANEKTLPWNVWVMIFRATFQRESKQKHKSNFQQIKEVGWLSITHSAHTSEKSHWLCSEVSSSPRGGKSGKPPPPPPS